MLHLIYARDVQRPKTEALQGPKEVREQAVQPSSFGKSLRHRVEQVGIGRDERHFGEIKEAR